MFQGEGSFYSRLNRIQVFLDQFPVPFLTLMVWFEELHLSAARFLLILPGVGSFFCGYNVEFCEHFSHFVTCLSLLQSSF